MLILHACTYAPIHSSPFVCYHNRRTFYGHNNLQRAICILKGKNKTHLWFHLPRDCLLSLPGTHMCIHGLDKQRWIPGIRRA